MNYQKIYNSIVDRGKNRVVEGYTERHHIIPRCIGGTDEICNLVDLTPEEHYTCHQLLVKIYPNNSKLLSAAMFMTANGMGRRNNKIYGWLKRRYSEYMQHHNPNKNGIARNEYIKKHGIPEVSKEYITSEWRDNIRKRMIGDKNPIAGIKPWNHPRATEVTKALWKRADEIYNTWITNNKPSYCKLYGLSMNKKYNWKDDGKEAGPFMNMVKYFRNGWIPKEDIEWTQYK